MSKRHSLLQVSFCRVQPARRRSRTGTVGGITVKSENVDWNRKRVRPLLMTSSLVSQERQDKIFRSMDMLKKSPLDPRSFAASHLQSNLKSRNLDVNMCFALTNQIKVARVIEMLGKFLLKSTGMALERLALVFGVKS